MTIQIQRRSYTRDELLNLRDSPLVVDHPMHVHIDYETLSKSTPSSPDKEHQKPNRSQFRPITACNKASAVASIGRKSLSPFSRSSSSQSFQNSPSPSKLQTWLDSRMNPNEETD